MEKEYPSHIGNIPTPEYNKRQAEARRHAEAQADKADYNTIQGATNRILDRRVCQDVLFQRAGELERQAVGYRRLAELVGATSEHDYPLFMTLLSITERR